MTAPVLDGGVWHAPIFGALLPCASEAIAQSVLEVHNKISPNAGRVFAPAPELEQVPEPVEEVDDEGSEEVPEQQRCLYAQCQLRRVEGAEQGYGFCERHMKKTANFLGWPLEALMENTTDKDDE